MNIEAPTIQKGRKFDQVLDGAREVFLRDGFSAANVDDIAKAAGVSKATLYKYFPDKRLLFIEMATAECKGMADRTLELINPSNPPAEVLKVAGVQIVRFLTSPLAQQMFRVCISERDRFPELAQAFYKNGPEHGKCRMVEYLEEARDRGELKIDDLMMAAEQFSELCKARVWNLAMFGIQDRFSDAEIEDVAQNAVDTFMARYGA